MDSDIIIYWTIYGYRSLEEIENTEFNDPLLHSARILIENSVLSSEDIISIYKSEQSRVHHIFETATRKPKLQSEKKVMEAITAHDKNRKFPNFP